MHLETGTGGTWDDPTADQIAAAINQLDGGDDSFAILSQASSGFIQTFGSRDAGFDLEYREAKPLDQQYEVPGGVRDIAPVIKAFQDYAAGGDAWRTTFAWEEQGQSWAGDGPSERQRGDAETAEESAIHGTGAPTKMTGHRYAIQCPLCQQREFIETASKVWFMYGFILFTRYGSRVHIGCRACVRQQVASSLLKNLLGGWWCIPWGSSRPSWSFRTSSPCCYSRLLAWLRKRFAMLESILMTCGLTRRASQVKSAICCKRPMQC